jgi:hypothetical protein
VDACLPLRCLATDFLQLRTPARRGPHRKHCFPSIVACIRVYKAAAWQRIDQILHNINLYERVIIELSSFFFINLKTVVHVLLVTYYKIL